MNKKEISLNEARRLLDSYKYDTTIDVVNGDLIGGLYHSNLLESWLYADASAKESRDFDVMSEVIRAWIQDTDKAEELIQAITNYACYQSTRGFKEGFSIALNFIVQGMRFPTNNS